MNDEGAVQVLKSRLWSIQAALGLAKALTPNRQTRPELKHIRGINLVVIFSHFGVLFDMVRWLTK